MFKVNLDGVLHGAQLFSEKQSIESGGVDISGSLSDYNLNNLEALEGWSSTLPPLLASSMGWIRTGARSGIV